MHIPYDTHITPRCLTSKQEHKEICTRMYVVEWHTVKEMKPTNYPTEEEWINSYPAPRSNLERLGLGGKFLPSSCQKDEREGLAHRVLSQILFFLASVFPCSVSANINLAHNSDQLKHVFASISRHLSNDERQKNKEKKNPTLQEC